MSDLATRFAEAQARIKPVAVATDVMLELYALYKQGSSGDVTGDRPGMLDLRGRAKYDAWAKHEGKTREQAMEAYLALVAKHAP